ncbi:MAG: ATP-binding protein [Clostridiales bacterium]|nr:ATP-binding protein [Clostridiales bacterium]
MNHQTLLTKLHSLVIFRGLLDTPVLRRLTALLACDPAQTNKALDLWCAFCAELFAHTENFSRWLLTAMLEDENLYVRAGCSGSPVSRALEDCLRHELQILHELSRFDGTNLKKEIPYDGFFPQWQIEPLDLPARYREHAASIRTRGYGMFARHHVFVVVDGKLVPVKHPDTQSLAELYGYERERDKVIANTRALLTGKPANNVLLYGDAGTGKSSTVKAVANEFAKDGLRLIEVKKSQLYQIPDVVDTLSANPLKFILFIDDLSFSQNDNDFAALKAILEGSVSSRSHNLCVYATSNRRHLIKESFRDREGDDLHHGDTMQELMSLSARFGLTITYSRPDKDLYCSIVKELAQEYSVEMPEDQLIIRAEAHAIRNGGRSPRVARQFVELLKSDI